MPAEHHAGMMMASKHSGKRFSTSRKLTDGAHAEAEDLWQFSGGRLHPAGNAKDSIAHYVNLGQTKNMESLPYNTFKGGAIPHTYQTMSIDQFAEPDSQPLTPHISSLEFVGLMHAKHLLPPDYRHDKEGSTYSSGRDDILRAGKSKRYKTSYAKSRGQKTPYQRSKHTTSVLGTGGSALQAIAVNRAITTADDSILGQAIGTVSGPTAIITPATLVAMGKLLVKWSVGVKIPLNDPDLVHVLQAGLTAGNLQATIKKFPSLSKVPYLSQFADALAVEYRQTGVSLGSMLSGAVGAAAKTSTYVDAQTKKAAAEAKKAAEEAAKAANPP
jgi:hypothetical protein